MTVRIAAVVQGTGTAALPPCADDHSQSFAMVRKNLTGTSLGSSNTSMPESSASDRTAPISEDDDSCCDDNDDSSCCDPVQRSSCIRPYDAATIPIRTGKNFWKVLPAPVKSEASTEASAATTTTRPPLRRSVSFDKIYIRNYSQTVGDNPSVSIGTPIQLDWDYDQVPIALSVDDYESGIARRRTAPEMMLNYYNRRNVLKHRCGCSEAEIAAGERKVNAVKQQRNVTRALLGLSLVEDFVESACRKVRRSLWRK